MSAIDRSTSARESARRDHRSSPGEPRERLLAGLPVSERHVPLAGIRTAVLEGGDGPPMVLLHGPGEHAAKWLRIIPPLVERYRVVAPDLPGHGSSAAIEGAVDAGRALAWLEALIEDACPRSPILVGQILGGALAARFAARFGDRLGCLVLSDTLGLGPFRPAPEFGRALQAFLAEPSEESHDELWRRCAFDLDRLRDDMGECWEWLKAYNLDRARARDLEPTRLGLMEQFGLPTIPPDELDRISAPTALIWGRHDLATPLPVAQAASKRYGWPLHVIDEAADDPPIEQPEAFVRTLGLVVEQTGGGR